MKTPVPGRNPCFERDVPRVSTEDFAQCISSGCTWKPSPFVSVPDHPPLHAPLQASLPHCAGRWPLQCPLEHLPSLQLPWDCLHFCYCLPEWAGTVCKSWYIAKYSVLRNHVEEDVSFSARYPGCLWWIGERNQHVIVLVENVYSGIRWILHTNCIKCPVSDQQNPKCSKKYRQRSRCRYWPCICVWSDQYHSNSHWCCESHFSLYLAS